MDEKKVEGQIVENKKGDEGKVISCKEGHVVVDFGLRAATFQFPNAFADGFLTAKDAGLQDEITSLAETIKQKAEEEKKQKLLEQEAEKENVRKSRGIRGKHRDLISKGTSFRTHADALNECFGYNYKIYQHAYKQIDDNHGAWFPSIAKRVMGEYLAADTGNGWLNILCENDTVIYEKNVENPSMNSERDNSRDVFVFAKMDGFDEYRFIGLFRSNPVPTEKGFKYERIGVQIDLNSMEIIK